MISLRKSTILQVVLVVFAISHAQSLWAAKTIGTFSAQQSCSAYVSKNKQTNPDNAQVLAGKSYDTIEVNQPDQPSWYRVIVPTANPKERWVSANCGQAQVTEAEPDDKKSCSIAGQADSYVLALSWQPAFCETKRRIGQEVRTKETLINSANEMKHEAHGTQQPRHINMIGEGASTAQRSDSLVQSINQRFPKSFDSRCCFQRVFRSE
jgi:ribonuclease I